MLSCFLVLGDLQDFFHCTHASLGCLSLQADKLTLVISNAMS